MSMGKHGLKDMNVHGTMLSEICLRNQLAIGGNIFHIKTVITSQGDPPFG